MPRISANLGQRQEWEIVDLKSICDQIDYGYTTSALSINTGTKFLRITDITNTSIDWESVPYCIVNGSDYENYKLEADDIVIARTGATVGYAKKIPAKHEKAIFASYLIRLRIGPKAHKRYVGLLVESNLYKEYIKAIAGGAAQPNANAKDLTSFKLFLPPLPIQRKIAAVLSAYDDLIENNNRRIAILEKMAEEIYREWFVRMRFPGHEKTKFHKGVPEGWKVTRLGDVLELGYGKALKESERKSGDFPVYGSSGIVGYHNSCLVKGPGIIVGRKGNVGSIHWSDNDFYPIDTVYYVKSAISQYYLFYLLQDLNFLNTDAAVPGLNRNQAYSNKVYTADKRILELFDKTMKDVFGLKKSMACRSEILANSRDLLISRLITGKLSVEDLDIKFPPSMCDPEPDEGREGHA